MLLFDDSKKLEKALGAEAAAVIAHVLEKADTQWRQDLATRADLESGLLVAKTALQAEIVTVRGEMHAMKHDILRWLVGGFIAQTALLVALLAFLK